MLQQSEDWRAEADELHRFLTTLDDADWSRPTGFLGWTPWDVVAHLHYFDRVSQASLAGRDAFAELRDRLVEQYRRGVPNAEIARAELGDLAPAELLAQWQATYRDVAARLGGSDPKRRLPWFGPDMGVRMFTTARLMETWAHGQAVYDLKGARRTATDRLEHVATIGVKTYGWTFANRGLEPPGPPPYVRLVAPSGAVWQWNEPSDTDYVRGSALDFCQTVTQTRNVADTALEYAGDAASRWMAIAQCFAGGPVDPPKPGTRLPKGD